MSARRARDHADLFRIVRELDRIREAALAIAREDMADEDKAKVFSLLESHHPMLAAVCSIRTKLEDLERQIKKGSN